MAADTTKTVKADNPVTPPVTTPEVPVPSLEETLTLDLTQFDMREMQPEDLPPIGALLPKQRASLVTMAGTFAYVSVAQAIEKANELSTNQEIKTVEQAFQILVRERDRRRKSAFAETVMENKELPPTSQEIDDFNALVAWAKDCGNPHVTNVANSWFTKVYEDDGFNKSKFLSGMAAIRGISRGYGLIIPKETTGSSRKAATDDAPVAAATTGVEEPY